MNAPLRGLLACALMLVAAAAFAGVYRWVGPDGVVHFSDTPPPNGAQRLSIETTPTDPAAVKARQQAVQKQLGSYRKKQKKAAKAAAKAESEQKQTAKACARAQARVQKLAGIDRLRKHGADGKTTYLSGQDLAAFKQQARQRAKKLCAKS